MTVVKKNSPEVQNELTPQVAIGVNLISLAVKNFILYPESNSIRVQALDNLYQWLVKFLGDNEVLRLTVEKDRLMYYKDVAYQDKPDEQPLAAPLFRDSIQWFEFHDELTIEELSTFITLLCRFRVLKDEAEDDLATCLWEAALPHIKHKTADEFWEIDPMLEINALRNIIDQSDEPEAAEVAAHIEAGSKTVGLVLEAFNRLEKKPQTPPNSSGDAAAGLSAGQGGGRAGEKISTDDPSNADRSSLPGAGSGHQSNHPHQPGGASERKTIQELSSGYGFEGSAEEVHEGGKAGQEGVQPGMAAPEAPSPAQTIDHGLDSYSVVETPGSAAISAQPEAEDTNQDISVSFSALLNDLENNPSPVPQRQNISGAMTTEGEQKLQRSVNNLTYIDLSDAETGQSDRRDSSSLLGFDDDEGTTTTDVAMAEAMFKVSSYFDTQATSPFWKLSPIEQRHLRSLISVEEKRNTTNDSLGIIKIMLDSLNSQEDRLGVVDFIAEETKFALVTTGDVSFFHLFLDQLKQEQKELAGLNGDSENWVNLFLFELNNKLSSSDVLDALGETFDESILTDKYLMDLRDFLFSLPPGAVYALISILPKIQNQRLEKAILAVVAIKACYIREDITPNISSLKNSLILELINIIRNSRLPVPGLLMLGLTRNESPSVRKEATQLLLDSNPDNLKYLFHLIDDTNLTINSLICSYMGRQRNPVAERVLLDHLDRSYHNSQRNHSKAHVLNCYRALGLCASASAIIFLQDVLMRKNWKSFLGLEGNWHGVGSALALMLMPDEWGTREIVQKAAQSHYRNIRLACEQAEEELPLGWKINDDD